MSPTLDYAVPAATDALNRLADLGLLEQVPAEATVRWRRPQQAR
jgi:hypothetical protein